MERLDKNSPKANELGLDSLCSDLKTDVQQDVRREEIDNFIVKKCFGKIQNGDHVSLQSGNSCPCFHDLHKRGSNQFSGSHWERLSYDQNFSNLQGGKPVTTLRNSLKAYETITES